MPEQIKAHTKATDTELNPEQLNRKIDTVGKNTASEDFEASKKNQLKNLKKNFNLNTLLSTILILLIAFQLVVQFTPTNPLRSLMSQITRETEFRSNYDQKNKILSILGDSYLGDLPTKDAMQEGELKGLVASVGDQYTSYLSCEEVKQFQDDLNQDFQGIGARFTQEDDFIRVESLIPNSPAAQAGLAPNDILYSVGDELADDLSFSEIIKKIRGEAGTTVKLTIERPSEFPIKNTTSFQKATFTIPRQKIHIDAVELSEQGEIAWVKVSTFSAELGPEMAKIAKQIKQNPKYKYIVLDLRDNSGGLLEGSIQLSSYFLKPDSIVVSQKDRNKTSTRKSMPVENSLVDYPLLVTVNQQSASASEITTGALKDNGRAKILGKKTYGKGVVQEIVNLSGCNQLKLTIAEWLTPNGAAINEVGIYPDIRVERGQKYEDRAKEYFQSSF